MAKTMAAIIASPLCLDCTDVPTNQGSQSVVFCAIWEAWPAEIHSCEDEAETSPSSWRAFGAEPGPLGHESLNGLGEHHQEFKII